MHALYVCCWPLGWLGFVLHGCTVCTVGQGGGCIPYVIIKVTNSLLKDFTVFDYRLHVPKKKVRVFGRARVQLGWGRVANALSPNYDGWCQSHTTRSSCVCVGRRTP